MDAAQANESIFVNRIFSEDSGHVILYKKAKLTPETTNKAADKVEAEKDDEFICSDDGSVNDSVDAVDEALDNDKFNADESIPAQSAVAKESVQAFCNQSETADAATVSDTANTYEEHAQNTHATTFCGREDLFEHNAADFSNPKEKFVIDDSSMEICDTEADNNSQPVNDATCKFSARPSEVDKSTNSVESDVKYSGIDVTNAVITEEKTDDEESSDDDFLEVTDDIEQQPVDTIEEKNTPVTNSDVAGSSLADTYLSRMRNQTLSRQPEDLGLFGSRWAKLRTKILFILALRANALQREVQAAQRQATSLNDSMMREAMDLLQLFGVPYLGECLFCIKKILTRNGDINVYVV